MSAPDRKGACCGFPISHVATTVAIVYFFVLTVLAAMARRQVGVLEEASTAEGNDEAMWTNPLIVSLGCAILFALFDIACIALVWLLSRSHDEPTTALKATWAGTVFLAVVWMTFCAVGSYLSFGSVKTDIEKACTTLDTHCLPKYEGIQWASIVLEVFGLLLTGWMLVSTGSTVHPGLLHQTAAVSPQSTAHTSAASRRKPKLRDEEHGLLADGGASLLPTNSDNAPHSLGRHIRAEEAYSLRTARGRYSADVRLGRDYPGEDQHGNRDHPARVARRELRRVREEAERTVEDELEGQELERRRGGGAVVGEVEEAYGVQVKVQVEVPEELLD
ncbi:hypothetical protein JCM3770_004248 [Rhodotorula araucariae]